MIVDPSWVLALMMELEPKSPYRETFERSALAIARAAERSPLPGLNEERTVGILVSVAWFESRFQPNAEGDCDKSTEAGICAKGSKPHSFCMLQISESNFKGWRTSREEVQSNIDQCVAIGLGIMRQSFQVCSRQPLEGRLRHYAGGGDGCSPSEDAGRKSANRIKKAVFLISHFPAPRIAQDAL